MTIQLDDLPEVYEQSIKNYHMLMSRRVKDILIVASLFDACIINQEIRFEERIEAFYRDREYNRPPTVTWAHSAATAMVCLEEKDFDLVITTLLVGDAQAADLGAAIKQRWSRMPVMLLVHEPTAVRHLRQGETRPEGVDQVIVWSPDADQVTAMIQCAEDMLNVHQDTQRGRVPVILLAGSAVVQLSAMLPLVYREIRAQSALSVQDGRDGEVRRLLRKARPRVVLATDYESAVDAVDTFAPYLIGVIGVSPAPDEKGNGSDAGTGLDLLQKIRRIDPALPFLLLDADRQEGVEVGATDAVDMHFRGEDLAAMVSRFVQQRLGFGPMEIRGADGRVLARAETLSQLEPLVDELATNVLWDHIRSHDFTRWLRARGELLLAERLQAFEIAAPENAPPGASRELLGDLLKARRINRLQETIINFDRERFDLEAGFYRIGRGSLGGKARGLLFLASQLGPDPRWKDQFPQIDLVVPRALVLTTDVFDAFIAANGLQVRARTQMSDTEIAGRFMAAPLPKEAVADLDAYLARMAQPLAVRSSSLLEDSLSRPYAGIYKTYMLPNDHADRQVRLAELMTAIKLIYASTFFEEPRAFAARTQQKPDEEKMAVVIQTLIGQKHEDLYLPAISGVAQSYNYYPAAPMQPEDGIANIAVGLGKSVVDGERTLRFCPRYPQHLPQFSTVDDMLDNAQRHYYGLRMQASPLTLGIDADATLVKREIGDGDPPDLMRLSASTYLPEEHRVKDANVAGGYPLVTFAPVLKYDALPLAAILKALLAVGTKGIGRAVDIEFCIHTPGEADGRPQMSILQIRPMAGRAETADVAIRDDDGKHAFCYSENALGNGIIADLVDIVYVKPTDFDPAKTPAIAKEIARINAELSQAGERYLLIGPGRWGSADPWLGIPVNWADISGAAAIVETTHEALSVDPSQGSHFFHNLTSLGMSYLNITADSDDFIKPGWFASHPVMRVTRYLSHIRLERPMIIKVDGRSSRGIIRDSR
ncbi:MAG: PEP/pyruvate-binding domain-containing protein [Desulfobacterales bacterium]|nr:PEP/pyruvate-binding domain-containing protein [Desulfobacterales bacterium]